MITLIVLLGIFFTGGSLNPARSFGPDVVLGEFNGYHWIYWAGPALGALLAVLFYRVVKILEYENSNVGAEYNRREAERFKADESIPVGSGRRGDSSYDGSHRNGQDIPPSSLDGARELQPLQSVPTRRSSSWASVKPLPPSYAHAAPPNPSLIRAFQELPQLESGYLPGSQL